MPPSPRVEAALRALADLRHNPPPTTGALSHVHQAVMPLVPEAMLRAENHAFDCARGAWATTEPGPAREEAWRAVLDTADNLVAALRDHHTTPEDTP
jgi:hypothetical protein